MQKYCLGFFYYNDCVLLIEKLKPEWQVGCLNGIGDHIEENETPEEAMIREFKEETSLDLDIEWNFKGMIYGNDYEVYLYNHFCSKELAESNFNIDEFNINSVEGKINFYLIKLLDGFKLVDSIPILVPLLSCNSNFKYSLDYRNKVSPEIYSYIGKV